MAIKTFSISEANSKIVSRSRAILREELKTLLQTETDPDKRASLRDQLQALS